MSAQVTKQKENILVVDDTPNNLQLLVRALTGEGYEVRCARSGPVALSGAQLMPPDLILLDILMPQMDGFEVCQHLRQNSQTCDVPIIFLSVLEDGADKVKAFALGGNDYVAKPFRLEEVLARVKHQLALRHQRQTLIRDTARYQQINQELEVAYSRLVETFNSLTDGISTFQPVHNDQGKITDFVQQMANSAFSRLIAQQLKDPQGKRFLDLTTQFSGQTLFDLLVHVAETNATVRQELLYKTGDTRYWFEVFAAKLRDGVITSLRDISDAKAQIVSLETMRQDLYALATTDGLTRVANRYCFDSYLQAEWQRCLREHQPLSLLFGDIDKFKRYNDLCGHSVGDRCLQAVAQAIQSVIRRPADLVARYGGEEFAVLLPNTPLRGAIQIANTVQVAVRGLHLVDTPVSECEQISLSLGIACTLPQDGKPMDALIEAADRALYRAKARGGNTNCIEMI